MCTHAMNFKQKTFTVFGCIPLVQNSLLCPPLPPFKEEEQGEDNKTMLALIADTDAILFWGRNMHTSILPLSFGSLW